MIIELLIFGLILLIGGIIGVLVDDSSYMIFVIGGTICVGTSIVAKPTPTKQDVLDGKAYYQETQVITNNDTIKTYDIVWK